jgi:hypothetical protein
LLVPVILSITIEKSLRESGCEENQAVAVEGENRLSIAGESEDYQCDDCLRDANEQNPLGSLRALAPEGIAMLSY